MNRPRPRPITTDQIYDSHVRVNLVCGFYGPTHPECKKVVDADTKLYMGFMKQFTDKGLPLDKTGEQWRATGTMDKGDHLDKGDPLDKEQELAFGKRETDVLDLLQHMMRDNL